MKIAINSIPLLSPLTGIGKYTYQISKALREMDSENEYSYFYGYYSDKLISAEDGRQSSYILKEKVKKIPFLGSAARRLQRSLHKFSFKSFDLYFEPNFIPLDIKAKKTVATVADFSFKVYPQWHPQERIDFFESYFWKNIKNADRIIVISDYIKQSAVELGFPEDRIERVYLGYDRDIFQRWNSNSLEQTRKKFNLPKNFVLFVGSIEPRKNLLKLIRAYLSLDRRLRKEFKLVLVGFKGWNNLEIKEVLEQAKNDIFYIGYVSEEDLAQIYNLATLFAYPSSYEGFGLPVLEAMGCRCPVLTSNSTSLPEVCGDAALFVEPENEESIREGLANLLWDDSLRGKLGQKGFERARFFSWEKSATKHLQVFQEVC